MARPRLGRPGGAAAHPADVPCQPAAAESGIPATSEELQTAAFQCIAALFAALAASPQSKQLVTATEHVPALGKALLIILDSLAQGGADSVKRGALAALDAVVCSVEDRDMLASFLPKMISSLTKALAPDSRMEHFRLLERELDVVSHLLLRILSDGQTRNLPKAVPARATSPETVQRTTAWLQATAGQMKVALANVLKLRHHDKVEVRRALARLCFRVVRDCRESLSNCVGMMVEALVALAGPGQDSFIEHTTEEVLLLDPSLGELLRSSMQAWVLSLPRWIESKNDVGRRQIIRQLAVAFRLLGRQPDGPLQHGPDAGGKPPRRGG